MKKENLNSTVLNLSKGQLIDYIIEQRKKRGNKVDREWLEEQDMRRLRGIYVDEYNKVTKEEQRKKAEESQVTVDDFLQELGFQESLEILDDFEIIEEEPIDDYYDENGHLLSDVQRMERRENAKRHR